MTAKRFECLGFGEYWDNQEDYVLEPKEVTELLNSLNDENEQLRKDATVLILANQNYMKENEQLKKENYELHKRLGDFEPFDMGVI